MEFARERVGHGLPDLDLAAGKLPPALVDLAGGPLREQEAAVRPFDDSSRDLDPAFACSPAHEDFAASCSSSFRRPA